MNKLNKYIEKYMALIIKTFIIIQPILDVITSLGINYFNVNITLGAITRIIFLFFSIYYLIILDKNKNKIKLITLITYLMLFSIFILLNKGLSPFLYEIKNTLNTFYLPIIIIALIDMFKQYNIKINIKLIFCTYILYILLIIIPNITNTSFTSYSEAKLGQVGWFQSANAIGNILSILLPIIILYLLISKKNILIIITSIISILYSFFSIGTKVPIFSMIICLLINLLYFIIKWIKEKNYKKLLITTISSIIITTIMILIIPKTSFYKNLEIHKNYLNINHYYEVFTKYELIDHFIFSKRLTFLKNTNQNYINSKLTEKLIGIGYIENYGTDKVSTKLIEIDYFEILYRNGIIGITIYLYILIPIFIKTIKKIKPNNLINLEFKICITLILLLALFSGHMFTTPSVSIFIALIIAIILKGGFYENIN